MSNKDCYVYNQLFESANIQASLVNLSATSNFSVEVKYGGTLVVCNLVIGGRMIKSNAEVYNPIKLYYTERFYSYGVIPLNFYKREDSKTFREIELSSFFNECLKTIYQDLIYNEISINILLVSYQEGYTPELPASIGLSLLISLLSNYKSKPFAAIRLAEIEGRYIRNPDIDILKYSNLDLIIACDREKIINIECSTSGASLTYLIGAAGFAQSYLTTVIEFQEKIIYDLKNDFSLTERLNALETVELTAGSSLVFKSKCEAKIINFFQNISSDTVFSLKINEILKDLIFQEIQENSGVLPFQARIIFYKALNEFMLNKLETEKVRIDGRKFTELRKIQCKAGILPSTHGSALCKAGNTSVLSAVTLGALNESKWTIGLEGRHRSTLMNNIYLYPFSVGSAGDPFNRFSKFEDVANIYLDKSLRNTMPKLSELPYSKRVVYEILSTEGSTISTAVNAANIALKEAGVKITAEFASIDIGLIYSDKIDDYITLCDIIDTEKMCSDALLNIIAADNGIFGFSFTAKKDGATLERIEKALILALDNLKYINKILQSSKKSPSETLHQNVKKTEIIPVNPLILGSIAGKNFENITPIKKETNCDIFLEEDGMIVIVEKNANSNMSLAITRLKQLIDRTGHSQKDEKYNFFNKMRGTVSTSKNYSVGDFINVTVTKLVPFGIFVETDFGARGPVYLSELGNGNLTKPEEAVKIGDSIRVAIIEIDGFNYKFSHKKYFEHSKHKNETI